MSLRVRIERLERQRQREQMDETGGELIQMGPWPDDCICFPCEPEFRCPEELPVAAAVKCPLHGERFKSHRFVQIYVSKWRREITRPYNAAPPAIRAQYQKAWLAAFPLGYLED